MRLRGLFTAFSAMLLLAGMFVAVHRGARGRELAQGISDLDDRQEAVDLKRQDLEARIAHLSSRPRIERAARDLGFHTPSEEELVVLDLRRRTSRAGGGSQ